MFFHQKQLQYFTPPDQPDPIYAMKIQELIGGTFGEMTVMMQYLFQGWNCRGPAKRLPVQAQGLPLTKVLNRQEVIVVLIGVG